MARLKLVVTGDMEAQALVGSLQSQFPDHRGGDDVIWDKARKMNCTTSHRLRRDSNTPSKPMLNLARAMLAEVLDGKNGTPADLVVVIDDVELDNLGQEEVIAEHFRLAVSVELEKKASSAGTLERYKKIVRERCSFHVLRPMVESYFFADVQALQRLGVIATPLLRHATDVEDFEVIDDNWLPECRAHNLLQLGRGFPWWRHERHPKRYIDHLLARNKSSAYDETLQGVQALKILEWEKVPKVATDVAFVRALFEDLADWFEVPSPIPGNKSSKFYPDTNARRDSLLLRNL